MKKNNFALICLTIVVLLLLAVLPAGAQTVNGTYDAGGYLVKDLYSNGQKKYNFHNMSGGAYVTYTETSADRLSLSGTPAFQFRGAYKANTSICEYMPSMISMPCLEAEKTALSFEIQLRTNTDKVYIGMTCYGNVVMTNSTNVTQCGGVVRINLKDYIDLPVKQWVKVVIPVKYFMENGEFVQRETGEKALTAFDYTRINGMYFGATTEQFGGATSQNLIFSMYDNIKFIEYINEPERITVSANGKGADVSWSEAAGSDVVEGYYLFRQKGTEKAELIKTLSADTRHYTDTVASSGSYTYAVQAFNTTSGFVSLPKASTAISLSASGAEPQTAEAQASVSAVTLYDRKNNALASGKTSTYVNGVEATVNYSGNGFFDGVLKTELYRDGTLVETSERIVSEPAGISVVYNDEHQYTTLVPGKYTFKTAVYKNGTPVSDIVEKSFTVSAPSANYTVTVESTARQTMDGWGCWPYSLEKDYYNWEELQKLIMEDLGINITRYFSYPESMDDNSNVVPAEFDKNIRLIDYAVANGVDKYIITWLGPPRNDNWTEKNVSNYTEQNGWAMFNTRLKRSMEENYIDGIINQLKYIQSKNLPLPYGISIQNEPFGAKVGFIRPAQYERLVILLDKKLRENGLDNVNIIAFEQVSYQTMYSLAGDSGRKIQVEGGTSYLFDFSEFERNPKFKDAIDIVGVHTYDSPDNSETSRLYAYNYDTILNSYGKRKWMTEFSLCGAAKKAHTDPSLGLDYDIEACFREITGLIGDVVWSGNSAWLHHMGYYPNDMLTKDGYAYSVTEDPEKPFTNGLVYGTAESRILKGGNVYAALKTIFNNAPAGSTVKRATTNWSALTNDYAVLADLGAFENGNTTVVVLVNQSTEDAYVTFNNLKGTTAEVNTLTSGTMDCKVTSVVGVSSGKASNVFIPAKSVNIIVTE